jgi:hypothetical protein
MPQFDVYRNPERASRDRVPFVVEAERVTMFPQEMAGIPAKALGRVVANLRVERVLLIDAVDAVLSGL